MSHFQQFFQENCAGNMSWEDRQDRDRQDRARQDRERYEREQREREDRERERKESEAREREKKDRLDRLWREARDRENEARWKKEKERRERERREKEREREDRDRESRRRDEDRYRTEVDREKDRYKESDRSSYDKRRRESSSSRENINNDKRSRVNSTNSFSAQSRLSDRSAPPTARSATPASPSPSVASSSATATPARSIPDTPSNQDTSTVLGKNHRRNRKYKEKLKEKRAHYREMLEQQKMWEGDATDKEVQKINAKPPPAAPPPPQQPLKQRVKAKDKAAKDRIGINVLDRVGISIKDRLGKRCASSASTDSGVNVVSPPPMEDQTSSDPFSQPLVQTLCGVELQQHEVNLMKNTNEKEVEAEEERVLKEDFPDCPDLYADCVDVLDNDDKDMPVEEKGENALEPEPSKNSPPRQKESNEQIPEIVIDKAPENELGTEVSKDPGPGPACQAETECSAKPGASAKDTAQPAQNRLRKRKEIKESIQKAAAHAAMVEKIKIKREKIDEAERYNEPIDKTRLTEEQAFDFLKTSLTRPDTGPKHYTFSLFDKLDKGKVKDKRINCDGCKKPHFFYRFGDNINILLSTSTLANMKFKDAEKNKDYACSHFEYLVIRGGTFLDMERVATPIIDFLKCYFNVTVLIVCGINDLNDDTLKPDQYLGMIERVRNFNAGITKPAVRPDDSEYLAKFHPGDLSIKYICIPFPPRFSRLGNEKHPIKDNLDRTKDIANFNRYLKNLNRATLPQTRVPTLEMIGITEEPFINNKPVKNTHIYEEWYCKDKKWPRDKSLARDIVHLKYSARAYAWKGIHQYFDKIF